MLTALQHSMFHQVLFPPVAEPPPSSNFALRQTQRLCARQDALLSQYPIVVFDFETTGLEASYDRIIEVGAQKLINFEPVAEFSSLVRVDMSLSRVVQKITGISPEMLADQPPIEVVLGEFLKFIQGSLLVAHNASFDMAFLKAEASRMGIDLEWSCFCSLKMARILLPDLERKNLDALAGHYGLTFESRHRSIGDVKVTTAVLKNMMMNEGHSFQVWKDLEAFVV